MVNERFYIKINSSPVITQFLCNIGRKNPLETLEYYFERKSITFFNNTLIQSKRLCFCERMCIDMLRQQIFSLFSSSMLHHFLYWWMKMLTSMSLNNSVSESLGAKNFGYFWWWSKNHKGMIKVLENNQYIVYDDILDENQEHSVQICEP